MGTNEWFLMWVGRHCDRFPRGDWPDSDAEFWGTLRHVFVTKGVTEDVADEASRRLYEDPPGHVDQHPKALLEQIRAVWKSTAAPAAIENDIASARRVSADCEDCRGEGLTFRWRRYSLDALDSRGKPVLPFVTCYCLCPLGRLIERTHKTKAPEIRKRIYDLAEHPWLHGAQYRSPADGQVHLAPTTRAQDAPF